MTATPADSLLAAFRELTDPRCRRGIRHPFASLLALTFLGLLCRQPDFAAIARWARHHWDELAGSLGFTREYAPHPTPLSRAAARYSVAEFRSALAGWLAGRLAAGPLDAAVDGKTSKQAHDADGRPLHTLNIFAHGVKLALADWPVDGEKKTEPEVLKAHLDELIDAYAGLRVLTGDALRCSASGRWPGRSSRPTGTTTWRSRTTSPSCTKRPAPPSRPPRPRRPRRRRGEKTRGGGHAAALVRRGVGRLCPRDAELPRAARAGPGRLRDAAA
jgi:hypothetical protein